MTIKKEDRNLDFLMQTVRKIYEGLVLLEDEVVRQFPQLKKELPDQITFVHTEELEAKYPELTPREREIAITKEYKAVFLIGIGHPLPLSGKPHDDRAADYDDWWTANGSGDYRGLNGDIIVWDNILDTALELSSMGIRVCPVSLKEQSEMQGTWDETKDLHYHKSVSEEKLVYSIGGGIGIDRVNKWMLRKKHIGEVQVGIWPVEEFKKYPGLLS